MIESYSDDKEVIKVFKAIAPLLKVKDEYQIIRFEILFGIQQLSFETSSITNKYPSFGYHKLRNEFDKWVEFRGAMGNNYTCSFIRKIFSIRGQQSVACDLFLSILDAAVVNQELLKYLVGLSCQECCYQE